MTLSEMRRRTIERAGIADLIDRAERAARLSRESLERVLGCGEPLAAAALADARRAVAGNVVVTHPWTLRVRAPGAAFAAELPVLVSHPVGRVAGIPASEAQIVGIPTAGLPLDRATEIVRSVRAARADLTVRGFTVGVVRELAGSSGETLRGVLEQFASAGLATLDWRPGDGLDPADVDVHRAAHAAGVRTVAPVAYVRGGLDAAFLDRLWAVRKLAEESGGFLSAVVLPDRTDGASPLEGTSGSEDTLACALARLALGHVVPHVTVDAHVLGHKLAALLLSAGADDVVGAQAAAAWARPTDDGPRPLNPDRVRRYLIEARRSPELRDALFRGVTESCG